jgi:hypothetical protein
VHKALVGYSIQARLVDGKPPNEMAEVMRKLLRCAVMMTHSRICGGRQYVLAQKLNCKNLSLGRA